MTKVLHQNCNSSETNERSWHKDKTNKHEFSCKVALLTYKEWEFIANPGIALILATCTQHEH